jgi:hypothetical protein
VEYFSIYPFTQDREDIRNALSITAVINSLGGKAKVEDFIPNYLGETRVKGKSLEQQKKEAIQFARFYGNLRGK